MLFALFGSENEPVSGLFTYTLPDYPFPVSVQLEAQSPDGKVSTLSGTVNTLSGTVETLNTQVVENKTAVDNSIAEINAKDEAQDKTIRDLDAAYKAADTAIN